MKFGIEEAKPDLQAKAVWFCTSYQVLSSCYTRFWEKIFKTGLFQNFTGCTYISISGAILPGAIIESTVMVDAFNDDASFYALRSYEY